MHMLMTLSSLKERSHTKSFLTSSLTDIHIPDHRYDRFYSTRSHLFTPSFTKQLLRYTRKSGVISFGGGLPDVATTFPVQSIKMALTDGYEIVVDDARLTAAIQYGSAQGNGELIEWLKQLQAEEHGPLPTNMDLIISHGGLDLISKSLDLLLSPGDVVLVESPTYPSTLQLLRALQVQILEIPVDENGLVVERLEKILKAWKDPDRRPKLFYTVPCGHNPTGMSTSFEKKQQVYRIASQHDIIILEDDPYYYLQHMPSRTPSYLSLDRNSNFHRVIRIDSVSKILAPGLRLAWLTAHKDIIQYLNTMQSHTTQHASGISQALVLALLQHWNIHGFQTHVSGIQKQLEYRRDRFCEILEAFSMQMIDGSLVRIYEFCRPQAGMFVWVRCLPISQIQSTNAQNQNPNDDLKKGGKSIPALLRYARKGHKKLDASRMVMETAVSEGVLVMPGCEYFSNRSLCEYVRFSFSNVQEDEMEEGVKRFVQMLLKWSGHASAVVSAASSRKSSLAEDSIDSVNKSDGMGDSNQFEVASSASSPAVEK